MHADTGTFPHVGSSAAFQPVSAPLVVFTALDGTLRDGVTRSCDAARGAVAMLAARAVPVVLVADEAPGEVMALQSDLGLRCPFVCGGGAALYAPHGYFPDLSGLVESCGTWDVLRFHGARDAGRAIRLLISLYRASGADAVIVGLGHDWADRTLLREVDVPIIVGNASVDQERLLRELPGAYVTTTAAGAAGWSEAILGSVGG